MNINQENYEQFALDYLEGNLSEEDRAAFDVFLLLHPEIQATLSDFDLITVSSDDDLIFPNKQRLLRPEGDRIIFFRRQWISIAASLLLLCTIGYYYSQINNRPVDAPALVIDEKSTNDQSDAEQMIALEPSENESDADKSVASRLDAKPNEEKSQLAVQDTKTNSSAQRIDLTQSGKHLVSAPQISKDGKINSSPATEPINNEALVAEKELITSKQDPAIEPMPIDKLTNEIRSVPLSLQTLPSADLTALPARAYAVHVTNFRELREATKQNEETSKFKKFLAKANLIPRDLAAVDYDSFKRKLLPESIPGLK